MSQLQAKRDRHVAATVDEFDARLRLRQRNRPFAAYAADAEARQGGRILLDDFSDIPFLDNIVGVEHYQLRSFLRAGDNDVCLATCSGVDGYQTYNRDYLGLGEPDFIEVDPGTHLPVAVSKASGEGGTLAELQAFAKRSERVVIEPYMSIACVWELAETLHRTSGVPVKVIGPPPPITAFANNKASVTSFANALVKPILGRNAAVPTRISTDVKGIVADLIELGRDAPQVAIKLPRCASAMGNYILDGEAADAVRRADTAFLEKTVSEALQDKEWDGVESVLSVAWLDTSCSPSTQCWLPPLGAGRPYVDGVYEQLLIGPEKVFLGAVPAQLNEEHVRWMKAVSQLVIEGYQQLGYVGRCSFDFIIHENTPYLVECNGRWGGTSIPMQLLDRVFNGARPAYRARDYVSAELKGVSFTDLLECVGTALYDRRTGRGDFIVYNVGCLKPFGKFDVIALGDSVDKAGNLLEEELPRLLERSFGHRTHG